MSASLRPLREEDGYRAMLVLEFLDRYEGSPETQRTMRSALNSIVALFPEITSDIATFPWELAEEPMVYDQVRNRIVAESARATAHKLLSAHRQLLQFMARHGFIDPERLWVTLQSPGRVPSGETQQKRGLLTDELRVMLACCRRNPNRVIGARDAALLAVLASTGARRSEVAGIERRRLDTERCILGLRTKGGQWRRAALHPAAVEYLNEWTSVSPDGKGLFCQIRKNQRVLADRPLSDKTVWRIVTKQRDLAGLDPEITPHSFRRWFVTSLLENGVDLLTVTRAVGHKSPATTQRYDRRGEEVLRQVVSGLNLPTIEEVDDGG